MDLRHCGIENYYFGRGTNSDTYLGTDVFSIQNIQDFVGSGNDALVIKTGTSSDDTSNINNLDLTLMCEKPKVT